MREKRRHESKDSGIVVEASCSEAKKAKDVLHDKPDEVTNRELNDKLDKILKCVEKGTTRNKSADEEVVKEDAKIVNVIKHARSVDEILVAGFVYDLMAATVTCNVCEDKSVGEFF